MATISALPTARSDPHRPRVAVIGGGYAGMAAAVELASKDINVTVYEASTALGGRARRVDHRGVTLDNGLHILIGAYREALRLIRLVNPSAEAALVRTPLDWHVHRQLHLRASFLPAPFHLLVGLLRSHGLTFAEKRAAIGFMYWLRQRRFDVERDLSVNALLAQRLQSERLCQILWRPLCVSALNTPPSVASAQVFANVLRDSLSAERSASDLVFARCDLTALFPQPAAEWVRQRTGRVLVGQRVVALDPVPDGFVVATRHERARYSHVVCALPPHQVNAFLIGITALSELAAIVQQIQYQPIYTVWLQYAGPVELPSAMIGFTDGIVQWVFDRHKLCGQRGLLGAVISASGAHQQLRRDELASQAHLEIKKQLGNLPRLVWQLVIAEKRATFACTAGLQRPPQITPLKNLYLAGDYTASDYPGTIESAMRSGIFCARHLAAAPG